MDVVDDAQSKRHFIVIEGIDGSGKTTIAREVARRLGGKHSAYVSRKTMPEGTGFVHAQMSSLAYLLWDGAGGHEDNLLPESYWVHLQAAWYAAFSQHVLEPAVLQSSVIIDGWWYKLRAKLIASGREEEWLETLFRHVPEPDHVVLLDVNVEDVWHRKRGFAPSEMGLHSGEEHLGRESFLRLQCAAAEELLKLADRLNWSVVQVGAGETEESTVSRVAMCLCQSH